MPQMFQVLRCFKCFVFQVHQLKKSIKWICKMCGEKQSIKRHYGLGTGQECRVHVHKLNGIRGEVDNLEIESSSSELDSEIKDTDETDFKLLNIQSQTSKWTEYLEMSDVGPNDESIENHYKGKEVPNKRSSDHRQSLLTVQRNEIPPLGISLPNKSSNLFEEITQLRNMPHCSNSLTVKQEERNIIKTTKNKIIKPPSLNSNSKWAKFVQGEKATDNDDFHVSSGSAINGLEQSSRVIFSLCDDRDIDNVLNI